MRRHLHPPAGLLRVVQREDPVAVLARLEQLAEIEMGNHGRAMPENLQIDVAGVSPSASRRWAHSSESAIRPWVVVLTQIAQSPVPSVSAVP